jgi:hypothetical protein
MNQIENLSRIGDILAIPLFFLLSVYFYQLKNKTVLEYVLLLFALSGFILDSIFTYDYLTTR